MAGLRASERENFVSERLSIVPQWAARFTAHSVQLCRRFNKHTIAHRIHRFISNYKATCAHSQANAIIHTRSHATLQAICIISSGRLANTLSTHERECPQNCVLRATCVRTCAYDQIVRVWMRVADAPPAICPSSSTQQRRWKLCSN